MGANVINVSECCNDSRNIPAFSYESGLGKVFNYNGSNITFKTVNGIVYVNATEMAKSFGKRTHDFMTLKSTSDIISSLSAVTGIPATGLCSVVQGGNNQGTWMHEDLALEFSRWLSPEFSIWCNMHIKDLLLTGYTSIGKKQSEAVNAEELIKCTLHVAEFLLDKLGGSKATVAAFINRTSRAIGVPEIDYVPSDGVKFSATDLLKKFGRTETIHQFNKKMIERGLLEEKQRKSRTSKTGYKKFKCLTDTGLEYGDNEVSPSNPNEVQPRYFEKKFNELLDLIF